MRLSCGTPPSTFVESPQWRPLNEPSPTQSARRGLVVGLVFGILTNSLWHTAGVTFSEQLSSFRGFSAFATFLVSLVGLLALHELVHALVHPGFGTARQTVIGCSLKPLLLYAAYTGTMGRNRFVAVLLAPLLVLSVLPLLTFVLGMYSNPNPLVVTLSVVNAAASGVDLFGVVLLLSQVPSSTLVQNDGWQTHWTHGDA